MAHEPVGRSRAASTPTRRDTRSRCASTWRRRRRSAPASAPGCSSGSARWSRATASDSRSQARNRELALERLRSRLAGRARGSSAPAGRPGRAPRGASERRLDAKRRQSVRKHERAGAASAGPRTQLTSLRSCRPMDVVVEVLWFAGGVAAARCSCSTRPCARSCSRGARHRSPPARVFVGLRAGVQPAGPAGARTYDGRDRVMALYAPVGLLVLPVVWLVMVIVAFTAMFHALGVRGFERAFEMSGSSLLTLGFVRPPDLATNILAFLEAATGLGLLALLIAYLPTIYGAFSRREVLVAQLAVRRRSPPSGVTILARAQADGALPAARRPVGAVAAVVRRGGGDAHLARRAQLLPLAARAPLVGHRRGRGARRRVAAACRRSTCRSIPQAGLCVRGRASSRCARSPSYFDVAVRPRPASRPTRSASAEDEFLEACDRLVAAGIPVRADRDQAWRDFTGWRVNYDRPLLGLAGFVMAPYAPWSSDRSLRYRRPAFAATADARCYRRARSRARPASLSRRMNHSVPNVAANRSSGSARKNDSSAIWHGVRGHRGALAVEQAR